VNRAALSSAYTSGKKITVFPLNFVYSGRLHSECRVRAASRATTAAQSHHRRERFAAKDFTHGENADEMRVFIIIVDSIPRR
jgi:hypothetical protein